MKHSPRFTFAAVALLSLQAMLLIRGAFQHAPVKDEVSYLPAGISHWQFGNFDLARVSPPLVRMVAAVPVIAARPATDWEGIVDYPGARNEWPVGTAFVRANGARTIWLFTLARLACIPFSVIGGAVCYRWANELYGSWAAMVSLILWCFSPNMLAHGQLMTPDMGGTSMGILAGYAYYQWLKRPAFITMITAGSALGVAQLARSTWIILYLLWPVMLLVVRLGDRRAARTSRLMPEVVQCGGILLISIYIINVGYGFRDTCERLDSFEFVSSSLTTIVASDPQSIDSTTNNRFVGTLLSGVRIPLPKDYLLGIDTQRRDFEEPSPSYLRGHWAARGWWYYYIYGLLIKVPIGTQLLIAMSLAARLRGYIKCDAAGEVCLLVPAISVLTFVSSQTGFNHHLRYVLPIAPFGFIWAGAIGQHACTIRSLWSPVTGILLLWSVGSSILIYPHSLSYFNELVGGPQNGHYHLLDSNIDWGQDLLYLRRWLDKHPEAADIRIAYFGRVDPRVLRIPLDLPPCILSSNVLSSSSSNAALGPTPGWFAVSVNCLHGCPALAPKSDHETEMRVGDWSYFLHFRPVARAGYSIYIYHLESGDANRIRRMLGFNNLPSIRLEN